MYFGVQSLQSWRDESARRKKPGLIAASQNAVRSICRKGHVSQVKCKSVRPGKEAGERVGKAVPSVATPSIHPSIHSFIHPSVLSVLQHLQMEANIPSIRGKCKCES